MAREIKGRFFLVGCPRSGTTLLQSLIVAHSQVTSFPESKFFQKIVADRQIYQRLNLAPVKSRRTFNRFLDDINQSELKSLLPWYAVFIPQYANSFITALDTIALERNKGYWLEKTPEHLRRINAIEQLVEQPKFIHIVRNGVDVVASLYEMTQKYPQTWGQPRELEQYITRWRNDVLISCQHLHKPNHFLVRYENLLTDTTACVKEICAFLEIPWEASILQNRVKVVSNLIRRREDWKQLVRENKIEQPDFPKFYQIFDQCQQEYILTRIKEANLDLNQLPRNRQKDVVTDCSCSL